MNNEIALQQPHSGAGRIASFWHSTVGKKVTMGLTGLIMVGFVIGHLTGNLLVFRGAEKINAYGAFLKSLGGLLWVARGGLFVSVVLHIIAAVQLTNRDAAARPVAYVKKQPQTATFASRTIRVGGVILALFIVFHLLHFTVGVIQPVPFSDTDIYANMVGGFRVPWVVAIYVVAMMALGLHLYHGTWSAFRTLGLAQPSSRPLDRPLARILALVIWLGFTAIPVAIYLGLVSD